MGAGLWKLFTGLEDDWDEEAVIVNSGEVARQAREPPALILLSTKR